MARDMYNATAGSGNWHDYKKVDLDKLENDKVYLTNHMTRIAIEKEYNLFSIPHINNFSEFLIF